MIQVDENEKKKEGNNINMTKTEYLNGFDTSDFSQKKMNVKHKFSKAF